MGQITFLSIEKSNLVVAEVNLYLSNLNLALGIRKTLRELLISRCEIKIWHGQDSFLMAGALGQKLISSPPNCNLVAPDYKSAIPICNLRLQKSVSRLRLEDFLLGGRRDYFFEITKFVISRLRF